MGRPKKDWSQAVCPRCNGVGIRITGRGDCTKCYDRDVHHAKYIADPEGFCKKMNEWRAIPENREKVRTARKKSYQKNRKKILAQQKQHRIDNPEHYKEKGRKSYAKNGSDYQNSYKYGLTVDEYRDMQEKYAGKCGICGGPPLDGKRLAVEHCHDTGKVRGLACSRCNFVLGCIEAGAPETVLALLEYLSLHGKPEYLAVVRK